MKTTLLELRPSSRAAWRDWLTRHFDNTNGVWVVWRKKSSDRHGLSLEEAVEEALCFGWIDSRLRPIDRDWSALMFTPRRPKSIWSRPNKRRVGSLIKRGLMTPAGLRVVQAAKLDGSWRALDAVEALQVPEDFAQALAAHAGARQKFDAESASARKAALWWIQSAKLPATRARRITETVVRMS